MESVAPGSIEVHVRDFRNQPAVGALLRLGVMTQEQARSSREASVPSTLRKRSAPRVELPKPLGSTPFRSRSEPAVLEVLSRRRLA